MANTNDLTVEQLKALVTPGGKREILEKTVTCFNKYAEDFDINTPLRKAHFLAQLAHESDHFNTTVEYGGKGKRYAPWYGRGLIQTTWEENYISFYEWAVKQDLNPPEFFTASGREAVAQFDWAFLCAIWYWNSHKLNKLADDDNVRAITKAINGGYNGLQDRIGYLNKAKKIFGAKKNVVDVAEGKVVSKGVKVIDVQKALNTRGFKVTEDNVSGVQTIAAIKAFQKLNDLVPDGIVDDKTKTALGL